MPVTVGVNQMSVVHKGSSGFTVGFPDMCKTPSPAGPTPIPYANIGQSADTSKGTKKAKTSGGSALKGSSYSKVTGDEAGVLYGVASNGALVTPDAPGGMRVHQTRMDLKNIRKRMPSLEPVEGAASITPGGAQSSPPNRALILHALAKRG